MEELVPETFSLSYTFLVVVVQVRLTCPSLGMRSTHTISLPLAGCSLQAGKVGTVPNHGTASRGGGRLHLPILQGSTAWECPFSSCQNVQVSLIEGNHGQPGQLALPGQAKTWLFFFF